MGAFHGNRNQFGRRNFPWLRHFGLAFCGMVAAALAFPERASAGEPPRPPIITVQVRNYANIAPTALNQAEKEAGRIFAKAGVLVYWLACPLGLSIRAGGPCEKAIGPHDLRVRVLAKSGEGGTEVVVFGFTIHPALASVYYDYAVSRARADNAELEAPIILGSVIAHELGHLLLGVDSHADRGIMQARWDLRQIQQIMAGGLLFTNQQSRQIQKAAQARSGPTMNVLVPGEAGNPALFQSGCDCQS